MRAGANGTPRVKSLISRSDIPLEAGEPREPDLSDVARRARLVLDIAPGERRLLPEFGCRIHELELGGESRRAVAAVFVEQALERWTPGLAIERAEVLEQDGGRIEIRLLKSGSWHRLWITHRRGRREIEA